MDMTLEQLKTFLLFAQAQGLNLTFTEIGVTGEPVKGWNGEVDTPSISWERAEYLARGFAPQVGAVRVLADILEWNLEPSPFRTWERLAEEHFGPLVPREGGLFDWCEPGLFEEN